MEVGIVKGPGDSPYEFVFVTPDKDRIKAGEFVYYKIFLNDSEKQVVARTSRRKPIRSYPDSFLADPSISPREIANAIGIKPIEFEIFEIKATILGYYDTGFNSFINPRIPPRPGDKIFLAEKEELMKILYRKSMNDVGSAHIGYLLNREEEIPVITDTSLMTSEHMCILASTGSGKSYLGGVIAEELLKPYNASALLIIDPHGEYHTLRHVVGMKEFITESYRPEVRIFSKDDVKVRLSELSYDELRSLLPNLTEKMESFLNAAYRELESGKFTAMDLVETIQSIGINDEMTVKGLNWRIKRYIMDTEVIDDYRHLELNKIVRPGQCSVIQLTEMDDTDQQLLVSVLLRRLLNARIKTEKGHITSGEAHIPYPIFIMIEEAHRFASRESKSYPILKTILSEGRKFGVGVCLISQRPSKIDSDILSQCMTQVIMRIINPADQENIRMSVESVGRELLEELPSLTKGQAILAGVAINTPVLMRVRERVTPHIGQSKDAPKIWVSMAKKDESPMPADFGDLRVIRG
jgi:hypothetical protein